MGDVLCRGCTARPSEGFSTDFEQPHPVVTLAQQPCSLFIVEGATGACGKSRPCEQDGPEHGQLALGSAGVDSPSTVPEYRSTSSSESEFRVERLAAELTS